MTKTLTLLAGGGTLPALLAQAATQQGYKVQTITFQNQPEPEGLESNKAFNIAAIGSILTHLTATKTTHVALAGHLTKPNILKLRPDSTGLKLLPRLKKAGFGDDAILRTLTAYLTEQGFKVLATTDLLPTLTAPKGTLSKTKPTKAQLADIEAGFKALKTMGPLDIGQALVIHNGVVIGVEGVEGTDALLQRCSTYRGLKRGEVGGLLIKAAKPSQTNLADLPTIGPHTLQILAQNKYAGVAIQSGKTLILDTPACLATANQHGLILTAL